MSFLGVSLLGFFLGMSHALEADHLAAVASLSTRAKSVTDGVRLGVAWGIGHTATLFLFGSIVLAVDAIVPSVLASSLELAVGAMLVLLGLDVFRRLRRSRVHIHVHEHTDGTTHLHAHSHEGDPEHHRHAHSKGMKGRALVVGLIHGMAGSAALVLLAIDRAPSVAAGLAFIAVFGLGSILGMAVLSAVISVPLRFSANSLTRFHRSVEGVLGAFTIAVGLFVMYEQWGALLAR